MPVNKYRENLERVLKRIPAELLDPRRLAFKHVFGAIGAYVDGQLFLSCGQFGIALKLPQETLAGLFLEVGVKKLRYFPNGHVKKDYAVLPDRIIDDPDRFQGLVLKSIQLASQLAVPRDPPPWGRR